MRKASVNLEHKFQLKVEDLVATQGLYPIERAERHSWCWGGRSNTVGFLCDMPQAGHYRFTVKLANAIKGAIEAINGVLINGISTKFYVAPVASEIVFEQAISRNCLVQIFCPVRSVVPDDARRLSVALAQIDIERLL